MATPYITATTYTIDCETVPNGDVEAMDALAVPYVWPSVNEARETVRVMTQINRFPYNRYETREGTVYAFTEYGRVVTVIFLEKRVRLSEGIRQASRPDLTESPVSEPQTDAWQGYSPTWGATMRVDLYQDDVTGSWCVMLRVWNTHTGQVGVNQTEWFDEDPGSARARYDVLVSHYNGFNGH